MATEPAKPWHDSSACPECKAPCSTPVGMRDAPSAPTFANPQRMWCPACGQVWDEQDAEKVARAWWSAGAYEARLLLEAGK